MIESNKPDYDEESTQL